MKLRSSMTLFHMAAPAENVFMQVLQKFHNGELDQMTVKILEE